MGTSGSWPNFNGWLNVAWGSGAAYEVVTPWPTGVNKAFGQNPLFTLNDFLLQYPQFFGTPTSVVVASGAAVNGTTFTANSVTGLVIGQLVTDPISGGVPAETYIKSVNGLVITLTNAFTAVPGSVSVYTATVIPFVIAVAYTRLAWNSLVCYGQWDDAWPIAMGWFIAHYVTLYLKSSVPAMITAMRTIIHGEVPSALTAPTVYALSAQPPGGVLQALVKNGVFQTPGVDYTLVGNQITLNYPLTQYDALYATWPTQQAVQQLNPNMTAAQIAAQALATGILTSKSVGDVSAGFTPLASLESWGAWNLTLYGQQLATMAKIIGAGPSVIW